MAEVVTSALVSVLLLVIWAKLHLGRRKVGLLSLGTIIVLLIFCSYQITPLFVFVFDLSSEVESAYFFADSRYVPVASLFAMSVTIAFTVGWSIQLNTKQRIFNLPEKDKAPDPMWLFLAAAANVLITYLVAGSWDNVFSGLKERISDQFNVDAFFFIRSYLIIVSTLLGLYVSAGCASYMNTSSYKWKGVLVSVCLLLASCYLFWKLSRAAMFYFVIFALVNVLISRKPKSTVIFILIIFLAAFVGNRSLDVRYAKGPGLISFVEGVFNDYSHLRPSATQQVGFANPLDASLAFSAIAKISDNSGSDFWGRSLDLVSQLNPLPSFLIGKDVVETRFEISETFDVAGVNVTVPLLADLYRWSWLGSCILFALLGAYLCRFEIWFKANVTTRTALIYVFLICGIVVSSHQGARAVSRLFFYAWLYWIATGAILRYNKASSRRRF